MRNDTLLFLLNDEGQKILLAMKKVRFGAGKYNGVGGGVDDGETVEAAAVRETKEEISVEVKEQELQKCATIAFSFEDKPEWSRIVHVFFTRRWSGEPVETEEMAPEWFAITDIPYDKMWIDDKYWLPRALADEVLEGAFHLSNDGSKILRGTLNGESVI